MIVNIENARIHSDTTGWKGDAGTSFSFSKNVQEVLSINLSAHIQYKTQKDLYLLLANYNLLKANNSDLFNNMFYHFRYNRKLSKVVRLEAFNQWQQNKINNIDLRVLVGAGLRFKIHESKTFRIYAATLAMYEHEQDKEPLEIHNELRSDNYISFTFLPNPVLSITSTTFYQPLYRLPKDYRLLNQMSLSIKASQHLFFTTNWDYSYDASPPAGTPHVNYTITNGLNYTF